MMTIPMTFRNMVPPLGYSRPSSGRGGLRRGGCNVQGAAVDGADVVARPGAALADDARVPLRAAVAHAREAFGFVDPGFQRDALADVERVAAGELLRMADA